MGKTILRDVTLLPLDGTPILEHASLAIDGDRIVHVGEVPADFVADEVLSLPHHLVMPGLWNAHTHAAMSLFRSIGEDLPLERWFNERVWSAEAGLNADDVYLGATLAAAEMIRSGTVGFADHYFHMDEVVKVVEHTGMKALLASCVFGDTAEANETLTASVAWAIATHGRADGRVRTTLGPHSPYLCPPRLLEQVAQAARDSGLGVHLHVAETAEQVARSRQRHGKTPVALLAEVGLLNTSTLAAHTVHVDEADLALLATKPVTVVVCPQTHLKFGIGTTRVAAMREHSIAVALGSDGAGSNNSLDLLVQARLLALSQKHARADATVLRTHEVLELATTAGAKALGFADSGVIAAGAAADLIVLNLQRPHLTPRHDVMGNVLYAATGADVVHTMVAGRWLMRDRVLLTIDEQALLAEVPTRVAALMTQGRERARTYRG